MIWAFLFPGQYFDQETNLHYNYFRDYDPEIGRYIQSDPIGLAGGINTYGYVLGNPINNFDPNGLDCVSANGTTRCSFPGGPTFDVPTPSGFPANLSGDETFYHDYLVSRGLNGAALDCVMQKLIDNPTPGEPNSATRHGTTNNATVLGMDNIVTSYLVNDINTGAPIVVNMAGTGKGSLFGPGYVARYVNNGTAYTVGEGTNYKQSYLVTGAGFNYVANELVWGLQMSDLISECEC